MAVEVDSEWLFCNTEFIRKVHSKLSKIVTISLLL